MNILETFNRVVTDPYTYADTWKRDSGRRVMGYFCSYTPEEIIHAAGALPFRLFGTKENISLADAHLQTYCCSLVRGGLEDALQGKLSFLDGTVFPHTCDSIQRLSDIWRLNAGLSLHMDVVLPVKLNTESARTYMMDIIKKFRKDLEKGIGVSISDEDLLRSIRLYNNIRDLLGRVFSIKNRHPDAIAGNDLYRIMKSSMIIDREKLVDDLQTLVDNLEKEATESADRGSKRVILAGGVCNHPDIYDLLEDSGGTVIWDELCTGTRYFEGRIREDGDPVEAIAGRYYDRIVCPAKHSTSTSRGENLVRLVKEKNADGVIFLTLKFCDPHSFDYPYMKEFLDREEIPSMHLEVEEQLPPEGQLRTRFETFVGML